MAAGPVSRPWKRLFRISVRGLIALVLVLGAGLGWLVKSESGPARGGGGGRRAPEAWSITTGSTATGRRFEEGNLGRHSGS